MNDAGSDDICMCANGGSPIHPSIHQRQCCSSWFNCYRGKDKASEISDKRAWAGWNIISFPPAINFCFFTPYFTSPAPPLLTSLSTQFVFTRALIVLSALTEMCLLDALFFSQPYNFNTDDFLFF